MARKGAPAGRIVRRSAAGFGVAIVALMAASMASACKVRLFDLRGFYAAPGQQAADAMATPLYTDLHGAARRPLPASMFRMIDSTTSRRVSVRIIELRGSAGLYRVERDAACHVVTATLSFPALSDIVVTVSGPSHAGCPGR